MTDFASLQQKLVYNVFIWVPCSYIVILSQSSFLKKKIHQIKEKPRSYITLHRFPPIFLDIFIAKMKDIFLFHIPN